MSIQVEETEQAVHGIFLHSNYDAWIQMRSGELEVKRMNGVEKVKAVCSLHTELMPREIVFLEMCISVGCSCCDVVVAMLIFAMMPFVCHCRC